MRVRTTASLLAAVIATAGCGSTRVDGRKIFAQARCGRCHALAAAGTRGSYGPNLDQVRPSMRTALRWLTYGAGGMPSYSGVLSKAQIDAVASFVVRSARRPAQREGLRRYGDVPPAVVRARGGSLP